MSTSCETDPAAPSKLRFRILRFTIRPEVLQPPGLAVVAKGVTSMSRPALLALLALAQQCVQSAAFSIGATPVLRTSRLCAARLTPHSRGFSGGVSHGVAALRAQVDGQTEKKFRGPGNPKAAELQTANYGMYACARSGCAGEYCLHHMGRG